MNEVISSFCLDNREDYTFYLEMAGISYCDGSYRIKRDNSPIYIFEYILKGEGTVKTDSMEFNPVEGDIYILHRGSKHEYCSDDKNPWTKIWFNAAGPLIDHLIQVYKLGSIHHIQNFDLSELFYRMLQTAQSQNTDASHVFEQAALVFHELVLRIASRLTVDRTAINNEAQRIKKFLDRHIEDKVSIKELGNHIFRSPSQTIRLFQKAYGITPYEYLLGKKIETAKLLLLNTNMTIKEIAIRLKFADEHYFSNYFKSKTGLSPAKFRIKPES